MCKGHFELLINMIGLFDASLQKILFYFLSIGNTNHFQIELANFAIIVRNISFFVLQKQPKRTNIVLIVSMRRLPGGFCLNVKLKLFIEDENGTMKLCFFVIKVEGSQNL